ncbi:arginyl-tRNA synthetase [Diaporthe helianthi]|uniref:arginine--tRNA ligase n=1 Tax=Diaporthe helianthi TaxID=158607 RepID=A0A2P5I4A7_DIAHE|nr:arginyl-tRNA synthetase [Diaporthe helianthi]
MATLTLNGLKTALGALHLDALPNFERIKPLDKPLDIARCYLASIIEEVAKVEPDVAYNAIQWPNNVYNGDLVVILPKLSRGDDPQEYALQIISKFPRCPLFIVPFADGVHLRMQFDILTLARLLLPYIRDRGKSYGFDSKSGLKDLGNVMSGKKSVVIEFSSPNIGDRFHGKHLRSTLLGSHLAQLHLSMGWDVHTINYLGDWSKKAALVGVGWERLGLGSEERFARDPISHLLEVYNEVERQFAPEQKHAKEVRDKNLKGVDGVKGEDTATIESQGLFAMRNDFFTRMGGGDPKAVDLCEKFREMTIEQYKALYNQLNVVFDEYSGESQIQIGTMNEVEATLAAKNLLEEQEGSWMINMKKHGEKGGAAIIRDRTGSHTYLLRDIAGAIERHKKYRFDNMLYVAASDHDLHFQRVVKILEMMGMGDLAAKIQHVQFSKNSQVPDDIERGDVLEGILLRCKTETEKLLADEPDKLSLLKKAGHATDSSCAASLQIDGLSVKRATDHTFALGQNSAGLELLFTLFKTRGLVDGRSLPDMSALSDDDLAPIKEEEFADLLRLLAQFPDVVEAAYKSFEPSLVVSFLASVSSQVSEAMEDLGDGNDDLDLGSGITHA